MVGTNPLAQEAFWANKAECDDAEKKYYQNLYGKVRQQIIRIIEKCETNTATKPSYNPRFLTFYTSRVFRCFVGKMIFLEDMEIFDHIHPSAWNISQHLSFNVFIRFKSSLSYLRHFADF